MHTRKADSYETPMLNDTSSFNENDLVEFNNQYEHFEEVNALGGFWKVYDRVNQRYTAKIYYRTITPESAEQGDYADQGEKSTTEDLTLDEVMEYIRHDLFTLRSLDEQNLQTTDPDVDYRTGAETYYDMFIEDASGKQITGKDLEFFMNLYDMSQATLSDIVEAFTGIEDTREHVDPRQMPLQFDKGGRVMKGLRDESVARIAGALKSKKIAQEGTHEGYKNYATWGVALIIANERGRYEYWQEVAREIQAEFSQENPNEDPQGAIAIRLADRLKEEIESEVEEASGNEMISQLLEAALSEVDWDEVAESILSA